MPTVRYGNYRASYAYAREEVPHGVSLLLRGYAQNDSHSCGFLAALTVLRYYQPNADARELLKVVRPTVNGGTQRADIVNGLRNFGISARLRKDLTISELVRHVELGIPVIISVLPEDWAGDHWVVVRGFDAKHVHLTNHYPMTRRTFWREWVGNWQDESVNGWGLVCTEG